MKTGGNFSTSWDQGKLVLCRVITSKASRWTCTVGELLDRLFEPTQTLKISTASITHLGKSVWFLLRLLTRMELLLCHTSNPACPPWIPAGNCVQISTSKIMFVWTDEWPVLHVGSASFFIILITASGHVIWFNILVFILTPWVRQRQYTFLSTTDSLPIPSTWDITKYMGIHRA